MLGVARLGIAEIWLKGHRVGESLLEFEKNGLCTWLLHSMDDQLWLAVLGWEWLLGAFLTAHCARQRGGVLGSMWMAPWQVGRGKEMRFELHK